MFPWAQSSPSANIKEKVVALLAIAVENLAAMAVSYARPITCDSGALETLPAQRSPLCEIMRVEGSWSSL